MRKGHHAIHRYGLFNAFGNLDRVITETAYQNDPEYEHPNLAHRENAYIVRNHAWITVFSFCGVVEITAQVKSTAIPNMTEKINAIQDA